MSNLFKVADDVARFASELATVAGVGGVFYALKSFKKSESDSKQAELSEMMKNSIEVLRLFSESIIPQIGKCQEVYLAMYESSFLEYQQIVFEKEGKRIEHLPPELKSATELECKIKAEYIGIFNQLEQVCAYISNDLIIDDVVYPTVHSVFIRFCDRHDDLLNHLTKDSTPYKHVHDVLDKWKRKSDRQMLEKQKEDVDKKLAKLK